MFRCDRGEPGSAGHRVIERFRSGNGDESGRNGSDWARHSGRDRGNQGTRSRHQGRVAGRGAGMVDHRCRAAGEAARRSSGVQGREPTLARLRRRRDPPGLATVPVGFGAEHVHRLWHRAPQAAQAGGARLHRAAHRGHARTGRAHHQRTARRAGTDPGRPDSGPARALRN
jgi:hypothetical protein